MSLDQESRMTADRLLSDVVCGVDGTHGAYEAVREAAALLAPGGRLTLVAATEQRGSAPFETASVAPALAQRALERARRMALAAGAGDTELVTATGRADEVLLASAHEHSLLALGAPNVSALAHLFVGGIATQVARELPCSLLIARRPPAGRRFGERIMVASDASELSDALVGFATELASARGAELVLFHAPHAESSARRTRIASQSRSVRAALGERVTVCVEPGRPQTTVAAVAAREGASLLVVASRGMRGLRALGSVGQRLLHGAPCSVLILRPEDLGA